MLNPLTLSRKSPLPFNFLGMFGEFSSYSNRIQVGSCRTPGFGPKEFSSSDSLNLGPRNWFRHLGRLSSVSNGGSGGANGFGGSGLGGSGGEGDGGDGDDSSGKQFSFLSWYLALLSDYPVLTKSVTSAILTLVGDLICQLAIDKVTSFDTKRTFIFTFLGLVLVGPTLHFWYLYLSKLVTASGASVCLLSNLCRSFLINIGNAGRKAIKSHTQATAGVDWGGACKLAIMDTFPIP